MIASLIWRVTKKEMSSSGERLLLRWFAITSAEYSSSRLGASSWLLARSASAERISLDFRTEAIRFVVPGSSRVTLRFIISYLLYGIFSIRKYRYGRVRSAGRAKRPVAQFQAQGLFNSGVTSG